jgi:hypothetical protein
VKRLLELSVWADLRDGGQNARLLAAVAPRLGFRRVLIASAGPLSGDHGLIDQIRSTAPARVRVEVADPTVASRLGPFRDGRIPSWPARDLPALLEVPSTREGLPWLAVDVPVSVGRTEAEATARAASDPIVAEFGTPARTGLFGRLEDVQAQVAVLAAAGVSELCCIVVGADLLDHLAQLAAANIGSLDTHAPGLRRSPDPLPPDGWGGASRVQG